MHLVDIYNSVFTLCFFHSQTSVCFLTTALVPTQESVYTLTRPLVVAFVALVGLMTLTTSQENA